MKENKAFHETEGDLLQAIDATENAITMLSKHNAGLAQIKAVAQSLQTARVTELMVGGPNFHTYVEVTAKLCDAGGSSTGAELFGASQCVRGAVQFAQLGYVHFDELMRVQQDHQHSIDMVELLH